MLPMIRLPAVDQVPTPARGRRRVARRGRRTDLIASPVYIIIGTDLERIDQVVDVSPRATALIGSWRSVAAPHSSMRTMHQAGIQV
jgi:hypothetical protein